MCPDSTLLPALPCPATRSSHVPISLWRTSSPILRVWGPVWLACSSPAPREASVQGWPQGVGGWLRQWQVAHVATERQFHHGHIREAHVLGLPAASVASRRVKPPWEVSTGEMVVRRGRSRAGQHPQSCGRCSPWSSPSSPFMPRYITFALLGV